MTKLGEGKRESNESDSLIEGVNVGLGRNLVPGTLRKQQG